MPSPSATLSACGVPLPDIVLDLRAHYAREGRLDHRRLLLNPGEGTTGTTSLDTFAHCCGLRTWKYGAKARYMERLNPRRYRDINYTELLEDVDFASDTPLTQLFPYVLAAFPNAVVLHTTRNATEWVRSRYKHHSRSVRPFAWLFDNSMEEKSAKGLQLFYFRMGAKTATPFNGIPPTSDLDAIGYAAENSLVRCSVVADQYLEVPMKSLCSPTMEAALRERMRCSRDSCRMPGCSATKGTANSTAKNYRSAD